MKHLVYTFLFIVSFIACNSYRDLPSPDSRGDWKTKVIPPSPQDFNGDPEAGLRYLTEGDYIGSGVPYAFVAKRLSGKPDTVFEREGVNANINYAATVFRAPNGMEVVNGNCFTCHAGEINGSILPGLGNSFSDYQKNLSPMAKVMNLGMRMKYKKNSDERAAFRDFGQYFRAMAPYIQTNQPGANPAFRLAEACMRHRDPVDLTYQSAPRWDMSDYTIASDVPPLWHVRKKNALYYNGIGRGDFSKLLFQASVLGIPDSTAARHAVNNFHDVLAWLRSLEPPVYPGTIDANLASRGKLIFEEHCSGCHGTYGEEETYPNKLVNLQVVKTDPLYANYAFESGIVEWYNSSWFAQTTPRSYFEPELGYVAPPLDGIWATAPYLHNGSVPTLEDLLHSPQRPDQWTRSGDSRDYDHQKVGWQYATDSTDKKAKWTYDTSLPGYSNAGHTFGDKLTSEEREAVIEYLKTL